MNIFEISDLLNKRDFSNWTPYHEIDGFEFLYLENSWILDISNTDSELRFEIDCVLTENHNLYCSPKFGERYCYKKATIVFCNIRNFLIFERTNFNSIDSDGSVDFGNIDIFKFKRNTYLLEGDWGVFELIAETLSVMYE